MEIQDRLKNIKSSLEMSKLDLYKQKGARDQLRKNLEKEQQSRQECNRIKLLQEAAYIFYLTIINEYREKAIKTIETMGTEALQQVYGKGYRFSFVTKGDERKEDGVNNFTMSIKIESVQDGRILVTGLIGERGGGVVEIIAFALRIGALGWMGYDGPLIMDEPYKSMSNDEKIDAVAQFLRGVTDLTERQLIFATHKEDIFGDIADNIIRVSKNDGIAKCQFIAN